MECIKVMNTEFNDGSEDLHIPGNPEDEHLTVCGYVSDIIADIEYVNGVPTCKQCIRTVKFYKNIRLPKGC